MIKLHGKVAPVKAFEGKLGGITFAERAEVLAELDKLLAETDPMWIERLNNWSIAAKIRFLQLCRGTMLNSIENKGVTIPSQQPFRTIHTLIDQIPTGGGEPVAWETLFEGAINPSYYNANGKGFAHIWEEDGENTLCVGNTIRVTLNGEETTLDVGYYSTYDPESDFVAAGNKWLEYKNSDYVVDDGTDFYLYEVDGGVKMHFRDSAVCSVKIEKQSDINKPFTMDNPHLHNGYKFPVLPDRDESIYPCAAIIFTTGTHPSCVFSKVPIEDGPEATTNAEDVLVYRYYGWQGIWSTEVLSGTVEDIVGIPNASFLWSNYDVLWRYSGASTVILEKSEPVPVYE